MSRANFGGAQDWSSVFGGILREQAARLETLTRRAIQKSKEEQSANDRDMYDQWRNGLISDDEWLGYIRQRVDETSGDPEEHQEWVKTLREHETSIADNKAEFAFENGDTSIHQLIAYYQGRMKGVQKDSQEWRELASRFNQLLDKSQADDLFLGAEQIIDGIERGTKTYVDLRAFYQAYRKNVRPGSDLLWQIDRELNKINDAIAGGTGGGGTGGSGRGSTTTTGGGDPVAIGPDGSIISTGGEADVIDPTSVFAPPMDLDAQIDNLFADLDRIDTMMIQLAGNPGIDSITDPLTGEQFRVTNELVRELDMQYLRTEEAVAAAKWADGDTDGATEALKQRQKYIVDHMQKHNAHELRNTMQEFVSGAVAQIQASSANPDPFARAEVLREIAAAAQRIHDEHTGVEETVETPYAQFDEDRPSSGPAPRRTIRRELPEELRIDSETLGELEGMWALFRAMGEDQLDFMQRQELIDMAISSGFMDESEIRMVVEGDPESGILGGLLTREQMDGLMSGDGSWQYVARGGSIILEPMAPVPTGVTRQGRVIRQDQLRPADSYGSDGTPTMVQVWANIGGRPSQVWVPLEQGIETEFTVMIENYDSDDDGKVDAQRRVPSSRLNSTRYADIQTKIATGEWEQQPYGASWSSVTIPSYVGSDGRVVNTQTWYQDPDTRLWHQRLPLRGIRTDRMGNIWVDESGEVGVRFRAHSSAGGVLSPFSGLPAKLMQALIEDQLEAGEISLEDFWSRDAIGEVDMVSPRVQGMYWDPEDDRRVGHVQGLIAEGRRMESGDALFARRQETRIRQETEEFLRRTTLPRTEEREMWERLGRDPVEAAMERLRRYGRSLGIDEEEEQPNRPPIRRRQTEGTATRASLPAIDVTPSQGRALRHQPMPPTPRRVPPPPPISVPQIPTQQQAQQQQEHLRREYSIPTPPPPPKRRSTRGAGSGGARAY